MNIGKLLLPFKHAGPDLRIFTKSLPERGGSSILLTGNLMNWMYELFTNTQINLESVLLRLVLSLILGGAIGLERESRYQPAGLRTHILITIGSTLIMLVSIYIPQTFTNFPNGDPGRLAAQVVSGIGFLGAGAIFRLGANVRGLTTAATIWISAAIGLAVGAGLFWGALLGALLVLFVLIALSRVERRYFPDISNKVLRVHFNSADFETDSVVQILRKYKIRYLTLSVKQTLDENKSQVRFSVKMPTVVALKPLFREIGSIPNVSEVLLGQD